MSRNARNDEKLPEGWRLQLNVISGPLESGDLRENGEKSPRPLESGTNGEKSPEGCRRPECGKYSNWMPKVAPSN